MFSVSSPPVQVCAGEYRVHTCELLPLDATLHLLFHLLPNPPLMCPEKGLILCRLKVEALWDFRDRRAEGARAKGGRMMGGWGFKHTLLGIPLFMVRRIFCQLSELVPPTHLRFLLIHVELE